MAMKESVKTLIKSPAAFIIIILLLILALLFTVNAANSNEEIVSKIEQSGNTTSIQYPKSR
jgi:hypothetical protein